MKLRTYVFIAALAAPVVNAVGAHAQSPASKPDALACDRGDIARGALELARCDALLDTPSGRRDPLAYLNRGIALSQLGYRDLALADYNVAIGMDPRIMEAFVDRAELYRTMGQNDLALEDYRALTRLQPRNAEEFLSRGRAFDQMGHLKAALDDYDQAIQRKPAITATRELVQRLRSDAALKLQKATTTAPDRTAGEPTSAVVGSVGLSIVFEGGLFRVNRVGLNSPVEKAGVLVNDLVTEIDGQSVLGLSAADVVGRLRGPTGTAATLTVRRGLGQVVKLAATRQPLSSVPLEIEMRGEFGILLVNRLIPYQDLQAIVTSLIKRHPEMKGMILDIRGCHGGDLSGVVDLADQFLDGGEALEIWNPNEKRLDRYNARPGDLLNGKPIVVLVDQDTRSGAESVAAALQDRKRAKLLGLPTFGIGEIRNGPKANDKVVAYVRRISNAPIQKAGVTPDFLVAQSVSDANQAMSPKGFPSEVDLKDASDDIEYFRERPTRVEAPPTDFAGDYQLARGIEVLKSMVGN